MPDVARTCHVNILETSDVTLDAGTADTTYVLRHLYDRILKRPFKTSDDPAVTTIIHVDQGATTIKAVDRLLVFNHNLDGLDMEVEWSDNDADWTSVASWTQSGSDVIDQSWSSVTHRYWRVTITSPASAPSIGELWLTQTYTWTRTPTYASGDIGNDHSVEEIRDPSGGYRTGVEAPVVRVRPYGLGNVGTTQRDELLAFSDTVKDGNPGAMYDDVDQEWMLVTLDSPIRWRPVGFQSYSLGTIYFREVVG